VPVEGVHRPARAKVSASAIAHNVGVLKALVGDRLFCAVVKADGYGHGSELAAKAALVGGADMLAVALIDEGIELRSSGVTAPILLLAEVPADTLAVALGSSLTLTIGSLEGAVAAVASAEGLGGRHRVHVKVDTGMHRMGVAPSDVADVVDVLSASAAIDLEGIYTHLSVADGSSAADREFTREQIAILQDVVGSLAQRGLAPRIVHAANSAGALGCPDARLDMVRVGLALYGYLPATWLAPALEHSGERLEPALTLRADVVAVRRAEVGARPSYGRRRALDGAATIATIPFGYADGYPRRLFDAGAEVLINGTRYPLAGVVTMDMLVVDCGDDDVKVGDEVILLGRQGDQAITADEWAERAGTISWEILCAIGARVPRTLVD